MALARAGTNYDELTHTQINTIDTNAAACVSRTSTQTGRKHVSLSLVCTPHNYSESEPRTVFRTITTTTAGVFRFSENVSGGTAGVSAVAVWQLDLPHGHTLHAARVRITPATAHAGQPTTLPKVKLFSRPYNRLSPTIIATATHVWTSTAAYENGFQLTASSVAGTTIDTTTNGYFVAVRNESGTNSKKHMQVDFVSVRVAVVTTSGASSPSFSVWV
jgi:hypothetical protein